MLNEYEVYISYFHPFGCQCFILNTKDNLWKFDSKYDNEALLGYSKTSKAYIVYNSRTLVVEENIHVRFNDTIHGTKISELDESFVDIRLYEGIGPLTKHSLGLDASNQVTEQPQEERELTGWTLRKNHPESQIIGDPSTKVQTRGFLR